MKKLLLIVGLCLIALPAYAITCPAGQMVGSVLITPEVVAVPAVTHTVHHDVVTHIVNHPAITHVVNHPATYKCPTNESAYTSNDHHKACLVFRGHPIHDWRYTDKVIDVPAWDETIVDTPAWDETVIDTPAWDEIIVDVPAVVAVPAVYENQCVADPSYDVCPNLAGNQNTMPSGYEAFESICRVVDVCPNISGYQSSVPTIYDLVGDSCVPNGLKETPTSSVKPMIVDGGPPRCLIDGTCPCFSATGKNLEACIAQKYPNGKYCELAPVRTCFGQWKDCTPEAPKCAVATASMSIGAQIQIAANNGMSITELVKLIWSLLK